MSNQEVSIEVSHNESVEASVHEEVPNETHEEVSAAPEEEVCEEEVREEEVHEEEMQEETRPQRPPRRNTEVFRLLGGKAGKIREEDLFKLNLGFWLNGAIRGSHDLEKSSYLINSIIGGIASLRIHNEINKMARWAQSVLNKNGNLFVVRDTPANTTEDNRRRGLQAIIDYAAQRQGKTTHKAALVIPDVTLTEKVIASAFRPHIAWKGETPINISKPANISKADFWLIADFVTSMITSMKNDKSFICEFMKDISPYLKGNESNEELVSLVYKHSNPESINACSMNHNVLTSLIICFIVKQKGIDKRDLFQRTAVKSSSGDYFDIDIIVNYSENNQWTAHLPTTCRSRAWNVTDLVSGAFIEGLVTVKRDELVSQVRALCGQ